MSDVIRAVAPEDCKQVKKLLMESFNINERQAKPSCNKKWFEKRQKEGLTLVYETDGVIAGYIGGRVKNKKLYIFDFCVDKNYRGKGIGTKLLLKQRELALAKGIMHFWGTALASNKEAISLYKKLGYTVKPLVNGFVYFEWKLEM